MANNHHTHHDIGGVNPLRPYYIPPSIGDPPPAEPIPSLPTSGPHSFPASAGGNATGKYASKARDIFSDIDYKDYLHEPSPSLVQTVKDLVDELLWKYTSVLMAQPFEVAKTIMQVRRQDDPGNLDNGSAEPAVEKKGSSQRISMYDTEVCLRHLRIGLCSGCKDFNSDNHSVIDTRLQHRLRRRGTLLLYIQPPFPFPTHTDVFYLFPLAKVSK